MATERTEESQDGLKSGQETTSTPGRFAFRRSKAKKETPEKLFGQIAQTRAGRPANMHSRDGFWWSRVATERTEESQDGLKSGQETEFTPGRFGFEGSNARK